MLGFIKRYKLLLLSIPLYVAISYYTPRENFVQLISLVGGLFILYYFLLKQGNTFTRTRYVIGWSVIIRLIFIVATPALSDDYFRFLWDGKLLVNSENPYLILPNNASQNILSIGAMKELFNGMNSKQYYTVYPPLNQLMFAFGALFGNIKAGVIALRLLIIAADVTLIIYLVKLLTYFGMNKKLVAIYAFNPLVIIELTGNLHFEGVMMCFFVMAIYYLIKNKWLASLFWLVLSVSTKLLSLMYLPFLIKRIGLIKSIKYFALVGLGTVLLFFPFLSLELIQNFGSSLDLYFQKFEFNASLYYIVREVGCYFKGYNIIQTAGVVFGLIVLVGVSALALFEKEINWQQLFKSLLIANTLYLLCATIVHPWYVTSLVVFSVFSKYRFVLVWSFLIYLSYYAYSNNYIENYWMIGLEYLVVIGFLPWEFFKDNKQFTTIKKVN